jgi:hypothetical protein
LPEHDVSVGEKDRLLQAGIPDFGLIALFKRINWKGVEAKVRR